MSVMGGRDEFVELLGRAGLEVVGDRVVEEVLPPPAAWRRVICWEGAPTATVEADRPDLVAELNGQWHRLACEAGVLGEDGVFLVDVAGDRTGSTPRRWARVRLTGHWDLGGVLGGRPGQPEFVTLSTDGDALVGATTGERSVRLLAVDRIKERQEADTRAAAAETPEDRAAAWASLFEVPEPTQELLDAWARGLSLNPAAPVELRARLLDRSPYAFYSHLPPTVVDAALAHPDWQIRSRMAETSPDITPGQCSRSPATTRPRICSLRCGSGGPAVSALPTARAAIRTSPAMTSCVTPTTRARACGGWPWTIRSRRRTWWSDSAGTPARRYGTVPRPTPGCRPWPPRGCSRTPTSMYGKRPPSTPVCRPGS